MNTKNIFLSNIVLLLFAFLFYISILSPVISITIDESINFMLFSRHGFFYTLTHYTAPNNHIFFTLLQSLFVPTSLLPYFPHLLRVVNVFASIAFFVLLYYVSNRLLRKKTSLFLLILIPLFLFLSPTVTTYFIVARGYVLGLFFLLYGIHQISTGKYFSASLLFVLSGWTIPTYIYSYPLLYISLYIIYWKNDRFKITLSALSTILGLFLVYLPVINEMALRTNTQGNSSVYEFLSETKATLTNYSYVSSVNSFNLLFILSYIISFISLLRSKISVTSKIFILLLGSCIVSYLMIVVLLSLFHFAYTPYMRNGIFIPIIMGLTIFFSCFITKQILLKIFFILLLLGNTILGIIYFQKLVITRQKSFYLGIYEQFTLSDTDLQLIKQKKLKYLPKVQWVEGPILEYYSYLYSIPISTSPSQ